MAKEIVKKVNVFTGPTASGKTRLSKEVAKNYLPENVVFAMSSEMMQFHSRVYFSACTPKTELLVIDGIKTTEDLERWLFKTYRYIHVEKLRGRPFIISPEIILICEASITLEHLDALGPRVNDFCTTYEVEELVSKDSKNLPEPSADLRITSLGCWSIENLLPSIKVNFKESWNN